MEKKRRKIIREEMKAEEQEEGSKEALEKRK